MHHRTDPLWQSSQWTTCTTIVFWNGARAHSSTRLTSPPLRVTSRAPTPCFKLNGSKTTAWLAKYYYYRERLAEIWYSFFLSPTGPLLSPSPLPTCRHIPPSQLYLTTDLSNIPSTDHHTLLSGTYFNLSSGTSFLTLKRVRVAWFLKPTQLLIRPFLTHHDFPISL